MGIVSMTGFARAQGDELGITWVWEIKSVNGKSLDLRLRLAPGFDALVDAAQEEGLRIIFILDYGNALHGPAQAVVRCDGCSTLLLWSHGKVVRMVLLVPPDVGEVWQLLQSVLV